MRKFINKAFKAYYHQRYKRIEAFMAHPIETQEAVLKELLQLAKHTEWGRHHGFRTIHTVAQFAERLPIQNYETLKPYIQRMMYGERDVLWNGRVKWFSKSSGTTSDKSKFIPVSDQNLKKCHIRGTWDTMTMFYHNRSDARQFECRSIVMGGSLQPFEPYPKTTIGDVSAIMIHKMPWVGRPFITPDFETALMDKFDEKIERMAQITSKQKDVVMTGGVPTWTVVLFRRILELTGAAHMLEVWPDFQLYIHGGVGFDPYREQFAQFFPSDQVDYMEIYNATEGYFAAQNDPASKDMLLLLNNGIYYEFLPTSEWDKDEPKAIPLSEVEVDKNYAIVISTNAGLWRYTPGDTVMFTSTAPYKIKITGRTSQFVNIFGEEVVVANTDKALAETCRQTSSLVSDYTVGPVYFGKNGKGGHEWIVEFEKPPQNLKNFIRLLDHNLQQINSDYEAKRYRSMAMQQLKLHAVPQGTFHNWLKAKGKYGGQHKVPRLANNRKYLDEILGFYQKDYTL